MKRNFWAVMLVCAAVGLTALDADARRMGGGKSMGRQSSNVTQREANPPAAPTNPGATQNAASNSAARPGAPAAAAAPKRPWAGILGGIAAGLGLAWLANALGLGAGFANMLLILLVALAGFAAWRYFSARSRPSQAGNGGLAFQGAGAGRMPTQYSPNNVGNDASARPFERSPQLSSFDSTPAAGGGAHSALGGTGVSIGSALSGAQGWGVPAGFDTEGFLKAAKRNFVTLQDAWDRADITALRTMMTDGMVEELQAQLAEREAASGGQPNKTEVVMLDAQLLGIEELPDAYLASVEFSGMIREDDSAGPSPFREVWNMSKPLHGGGWLVAGVQALQ
ncbi:Tim44 domain-containing protein [Xenophilus sp. Marseille-Q4582]|uniref:Tim44 domain-containing protein n=1 Tax=Xenophilus sp. Marseille-Q4582 TaxID=2866600 RepID=UPI001CE40E0D|nr:TIM44-like domain-containing protein [Xenophilus sp. Marseille-Q4582]